MRVEQRTSGCELKPEEWAQLFVLLKCKRLLVSHKIVRLEKVANFKNEIELFPLHTTIILNLLVLITMICLLIDW